MEEMVTVLRKFFIAGILADGSLKGVKHFRAVVGFQRFNKPDGFIYIFPN